MQCLHNSLEHRYRHPFGAQPAGATVRIRIEAGTKQQPAKRVYLHYAYGRDSFDRGCVRMYPLEQEYHLFSHFLPLPDEPCLLFYWFEICSEQEEHFYYARPHEEAAEGVCLDSPPQFAEEAPRRPWPFQITVYAPAFGTPSWAQGAVAYQIFPDRFARARDFDWTSLRARKEGEEYSFHENWDEEVEYEGRTEEGYLACDFFGGSIQGIREHLDYLQSLHVEILYLNPIAKARSNHRYDTGDYLQVDPLLGDEQTFAAFCEEALARGIRVVLDGVYSHTGADSLYFNREGRYPGTGAYQEMLSLGESIYRDWYHLEYQQDSIVYDAWWGFPDLPVLNKQNLDYRNFICGDQGVLAHWLHLGASGFRLDVADELPEPFLRALRKRVRETQADALIWGEVWEDPSNKVSYGHYRDFALGRTLDAAMNYPWAQTVVDYLSGRSSAETLKMKLENLQQNLPPAFFHTQMNLLSSHDIARAIYRLLAIPDPGSRAKQSQIHLTASQRRQGKRLLQLAYLLNFCYPGCPCIYYGDELAMEGFRDPFNRRPFAWSQVEAESALLGAFRSMTRVRREYPVLRVGGVQILYAQDRRLILLRMGRLGKDALGRPMEGPQFALLFLNPEETPWELHEEERAVLQAYPIAETRIPPGSGVLCVDGHTYCWTPEPFEADSLAGSEEERGVECLW